MVLGMVAKTVSMISTAQTLPKALKRLHGSFHGIVPLSWLLAFALYSVSQAQAATPLLAVREAGSFLYARQDIASDKLATLQKDERLIPLAEAVGPETWYMVKTQYGFVGWVRASDVSPSNQLKDLFKVEHVSTWSARTSNGRGFEGTWSVEAEASSDKVVGTWTLYDGAGKLILHGTWSAQKFSTGWSGIWHASTENRQGDYGGSWTTDFPHRRDARFGEIFEAAAHDAIRGIWNAGDLSGSWLIRAAQ
jgi:hypothetical protein